jgi:L-ascorbate metabolism protein UlaG (beta-lactamase superfamily)
MLLRVAGLTILTDPHFHETSGPRIAGRPVGRRRSTALPMALEDLPPIDIILLSHAHMDHWDKRSLARLASPDTIAVIPPRTRNLLPNRGRTFGDINEVRWGAEANVRGLRIGAERPRHWGARWALDWWRGFNAYILSTDSSRILFSGDTGETSAFDGIGPVDLAILGIGNSYAPWSRFHTNPEQAAAMADRMGAHLIAPVHHATFHDPTEARDEPLDRLRRVWPEHRTVCARVGEGFYRDPA